MNIKYDRLPEHMRHGAKLYIEHGIRPGGFLTAVLENNLVLAFQLADGINQGCMKDWAVWLTWDIPSLAWGSAEMVDIWSRAGGMGQFDDIPD